MQRQSSSGTSTGLTHICRKHVGGSCLEGLVAFIVPLTMLSCSLNETILKTCIETCTFVSLGSYKYGAMQSSCCLAPILTIMRTTRSDGLKSHPMLQAISVQ